MPRSAKKRPTVNWGANKSLSRAARAPWYGFAAGFGWAVSELRQKAWDYPCLLLPPLPWSQRICWGVLYKEVVWKLSWQRWLRLEQRRWSV